MMKVKTKQCQRFYRILYLEQQSNILRCFCSLKFGKVYIAISLPVVYFAVEGYTTKDLVKYLAQN